MRNHRVYGTVSGCFLLAIRLCVLSVAVTGFSAPVRNMILCVGDGMGPEEVKAARYFAGTNLFFETLPYQSQMTTWPADSPVTDSAASATAMATGTKVNNGVLSMRLPGDGGELQTLLEYFQAAGKSVGLVTTTYITHATPAAFGAHEIDRNNLSQIAVDYLNQTRPNVLFGGGGNGMSIPAADLAGYTVVTNRETLFALDTANEPYVSGQFGLTHLPYEYDGLGDLPRLPEMTVTALDLLDNDPDGFFLMVEGGRIDHAGHANDISRNIGETLAFAETVQKIVLWAADRQDTLILVTADHETGGLSVLVDNGSGNTPTVAWSTTGHTDTPVPVYGWGLNAELAQSVVDNTNIYSVSVSPARVSERALSIQANAAGGVQTLWTSADNDSYRLEYTPTLIPVEWSPLNTVTADGSRLLIIDTNAGSASRRFYRLISIEAAGP